MNFSSKTLANAFTRRWKELAHRRELTALDMLLRARLMSRPTTAALPLPTNRRKLENGALAACAAHFAVQYFRNSGRWTYGGPRPMPAAEWFSRWADPTAPETAPFGLTLAELQSLMQETEVLRKGEHA